MEKDIARMLDELANLQARKTMLEIEKKKMIDQAMPQEVKEQIEDIELEFADQLEQADETIAQAEKEVKALIVEHGESVKSEFITGVYNGGRKSWDSKALEGYATAHPEILVFRKEGQPYVVLRRR